MGGSSVPGVILRPATEDDLGAMFDLLTAMHGQHPWEPEHEREAALALHRIVADPQRRLVIARVGEIPAGTVDLTIVPNLSRNAAPWAALENLVVLPDLRRRGIGRMLVEDAIAYATRNGCYKVQLVSAHWRTEAHALYRATGFDADVGGYRRYLVPVNAPPLSD